MSFISVLETVGKDFEHGLVFVLGDVNKIATAEAPVLEKINPAAGAIAGQIAALTSQALGIATQTEQKLQALGNTTASKEKKVAEIVMILLPAVAQMLGLAGLQATTVANKIATSAVNILGALPSSVLGKPAVSALAA
jgi:thymidine phosphorylase